MSNVGIKKFLNYLTYDVGGAGQVYLYPMHPNIESENLHIVIPIYNSKDINKISVNAIYSKQIRGITNSDSTSNYSFPNEFGAGTKLDSRIILNFNGNQIIKTNADGSTTIYYQTEDNNIYMEFENFTKYDKEYNQIIDSHNNIIELDITHNATIFKGYPKRIIYADGTILTYSANSTTHLLEEIASNFGQKVNFTYDSSNFITEVIVSEGNEIIEEINLSYSNRSLQTIERRKNANNILYGLYSYNLAPEPADNNITIYNYYESKYIYFFMHSGKIIKVWESRFQISNLSAFPSSNVIQTFISTDDLLPITIIDKFKVHQRELYFDSGLVTTNEELYRAAQVNYEIIDGKYIKSYYYSGLNLIGTSNIQLIDKSCITNNLVNNGYFENNMENWEIISGRVSVIDEINGNEQVHPNKCLGDNVITVQNNGKVKQTINLYESLYINSHEQYIFYFFSAQKTYDVEQNAKVSISLSFDNDIIQEKSIEVSSANNYKYNIVNLNPNKAVNKIEIIIEVKGNSEYHFDGFTIVKGKATFTDSYNGNTMFIENGNYVENVIYNDLNYPIHKWDNYGNIIDFSYSNNKNKEMMIEKENVNNDTYTFNYEYYSNNKIVKRKITRLNNNPIEIVKYDEKNRIVYKIGNNNCKIKYAYDDYDRILSISYFYSNISDNIIDDEYNGTLIFQKSFIYNNYVDELNSQSRIEEIITYIDNQHVYDTILINGIISDENDYPYSVRYSLPSSEIISEVKYTHISQEGEIPLYNLNDVGAPSLNIEHEFKNKKTNDFYEFSKHIYFNTADTSTYLGKKLLYETRIGDTNDTLYITYNYEYDDLKRLKSITTKKGQEEYVQTYNYNSLNQLTMINNEGIYCRYAYNYDNTLGMTCYKSSKETYVTFAPLNKLLYINKKVFFHEYMYHNRDGEYIASFAIKGSLETYVKNENNRYEYHQIDTSANIPISYFNNNSYISNDNSRCLSYSFNKSYESIPNINVSFWLMIDDSSTNDSYILNISDNSNHIISLKYTSTRYLYLVINSNANITNYSVDVTLDLNKWYFISLSISDIIKLQIDTSKYEFEINSQLSSLDILNFGYKEISENNKLNPVYGKFSALLVNTTILPDENYIERYRKASKVYLIDNDNTNTNSISDNSYSGTYVYTNELDYQQITRIPLNNTFITVGMSKPKLYNSNDLLDNEINKNFVFDEDINRHVYFAHGQDLIYSTPSANSHTILMKIKSFGKKARAIFEYKCNQSKKIYLYTNNQNQLRLYFLDKIIQTQLTIKENEWSNVSVSWEKMTADYYETGGYNIRIRVDNHQFLTSSNNTSFILSPRMNIGTSFTKINDEYGNSGICPFDGLITDVGLSSIYMTSSAVDNYFDNTPTIVNIKKYNEDGMLIKHTVANSVEKVFLYDSYNRVTSETNNKSQADQISYTYNGDLVSRIETPNYTKLYYYDNKHQLIKSICGNNQYEYAYDIHGNIISKTKDEATTINYEYDNLNRLIKYNNLEFEYDTLSSLPKSYAIQKENDIIVSGYEYTWISNRLTQLKKYERNDNGVSVTEVTYEYDHNDIRTHKEVNQNGAIKTYDYIYFNGLLKYEKVSENTTNYEIEYLYDENNIIYGFKYLKEATEEFYIYKRDVLGNINGILDANNQEVVTYEYEDYGTIKSEILNNSNTNARFNSIKYKGYYYDVETGLFWLSSRYYSPELGRFIQPADVSTLNPSSINGLNLYSYANNNPIGIAYSSSSAGFDSNGGMISSIGNAFGSIGNSISGSSSRIPLPTVPWLVENATTMYGTAASLISGTPILAHYFKYASIINDEFKLYGISKWKTSLQLSNVNLKMGALDGALIGVNVLIDMYDSYQRGVSTEGILLGGTLTAASGVGMFYLNKGIMWSTTAIGTAICPGLGTAIGFTVGLGISLFVDWKLGELISDWIDSITS